MATRPGTYRVVAANPYGAVTSAPVTLTVDAPTKLVILWQPYGDTVGVGGSYQFSAAAAGTLPLIDTGRVVALRRPFPILMGLTWSSVRRGLPFQNFCA